MTVRSLHKFIPLLLFLPGPAQAQSSDVIVGNWRVSQAIPQTCQAITRVNDHLTINVIIRKTNGSGVFFMQSDAWNLPERGTFSGAISWNDWAGSHDVVFDSGKIESDGLLALPFEDASFTQSLSEAQHLWFRAPNLYIGGDFKIEGFDPVLAALNSCLNS